MQGDTYILSTMSGQYDVNPNNTSEVYVRLRGALAPETTAIFTITRINGQDIDPATLEVGNFADYILVQCMDFTQNWSLEGTAQFLLVEGPDVRGSAPSFQIKLTQDLGLVPNSCEPIPTGCCVCDDGDCNITTEDECAEMGLGCFYQGDDIVCDGIDICSDDPGCCFLNPDELSGAIANSEVDPDKCVETTAAICNLDGGSFQGIGTSCRIDFPEQCLFPTRNVPALSHWGLIITTGLMGLIAIMILRRRKALA